MYGEISKSLTHSNRSHGLSRPGWGSVPIQKKFGCVVGGQKNTGFWGVSPGRLGDRQQHAHFQKALCKSYPARPRNLKTTKPVSRYPLPSGMVTRAPDAGGHTNDAMGKAKGRADCAQTLWEVITCIGGLFGPVTCTPLCGSILGIPFRVNLPSITRGLSPRRGPKSNLRI